MDKKILQTGLYETQPSAVETFIGRVNQFNLSHIGNAIKLDVIPYEEGDEFVPAPHYKYRLLFPSREIQRAFWTN